MQIYHKKKVDRSIKSKDSVEDWLALKGTYLAEKPWDESWRRASSRMLSPTGRRCLIEAEADAAAEGGLEEVADLCEGGSEESTKSVVRLILLGLEGGSKESTVSIDAIGADGEVAVARTVRWRWRGRWRVLCEEERERERGPFGMYSGVNDVNLHAWPNSSTSSYTHINTTQDIGFSNKAEKYHSSLSTPRSNFIPVFHLSVLNPTLSNIGTYVPFSCDPKQKNLSSQKIPPGLNTLYTSYRINSIITSGIQLLITCIECTISSVFSKNGSLSETVTCIEISPRDEIKLLKGPSKFIEVVTIVTFLSIIRAANEPDPPPISSPIRIVPFGLVARTRSIPKSSPPLSRSHRTLSLPCVGVPDDAGVGRGGPEAGGQRVGFGVVGEGGFKAAGADGEVDLVGAHAGVVAEGELVGPEAEFGFVGEEVVLGWELGELGELGE
ncbi:auxin response factor 8 [Striga asiatica]|uniref:Auxin response factor 8 n=1 Tax=Striga asiatica TaxID=4170 RepID=A0A5A7Q262_STRAF|nr:auxin response factor 8 [Striga asiatica]